jgi:GntR family transcriptional regulator of vanillate catabolism
MILTGALPAGKRVPELHLVDRTGVSRTPLRIAMERLAHEGLLERRARGGFTVRAFTRTEIEHAIELRGVLEGTAARLASERARQHRHLERMAALVDELDGAIGGLPAMDAFEGYVRLNEQFHDLLLAMPESELLRSLIRQVTTVPFASPSAFLLVHARAPESQQILAIAQVHHRSIVEAIARGEGARAEAIAREHARLSLWNLDAALRDSERLRALPGAALIRLG